MSNHSFDPNRGSTPRQVSPLVHQRRPVASMKIISPSHKPRHRYVPGMFKGEIKYSRLVRSVAKSAEITTKKLADIWVKRPEKEEKEKNKKISRVTAPRFIGPKIGGAKIILRPEVRDYPAQKHDKGDISRLDGTATPDPPLQRHKKEDSNTSGIRDTNPMAVPSGWRIFWGRVRPEYEEMATKSISVSSFCKDCYDKGTVSHECKSCDCPLFLIKFSNRLAEEPDATAMLVLLLGDWSEAQGTDRAVPISNSTSSSIPFQSTSTTVETHLSTASETPEVPS